MAARAKSKQPDIGAATPGLPACNRGTTLSQHIDIVRLQATSTFGERRTLDNEYRSALMSIQKDIDHHMDLAKLCWDAKDRRDPIFSKINEFFDKKHKLIVTFAEKQSILNELRQKIYALIDNTLAANASKKKRSKSSATSSIRSTTNTGLTAPSSSRGVGIVVPTPPSSTTGEVSPHDQERVEFMCIQPPPFVFPSHL